MKEKCRQGFCFGNRSGNDKAKVFVGYLAEMLNKDLKHGAKRLLSHANGERAKDRLPFVSSTLSPVFQNLELEERMTYERHKPDATNINNCQYIIRKHSVLVSIDPENTNDLYNLFTLEPLNPKFLEAEEMGLSAGIALAEQII
ncbi:hypothetical protein QYM36_003098 [Artemia franciscana]|uniref:Uncharacterized protein n=1 Tax=Artemia franciscana TaxID=6661 RepID=A0AA88I4S2_ARTSF|nr:hypothetical protein QYM36_003098 [Artemia franciscana]